MFKHLKFFIATACSLFSLLVSAQQPFAVTIADEPITAMPGIHSFAFAESNGKWLFIGGRTNGLHGFLTPFAFETAYANDTITVVDPVANVNWTASTASLPDSI